MSRPSIYSEELAAAICDRIAMGESLRGICKDEDMPGLNTVIVWLRQEGKASFRLQYERARELQAELIADEILSIADDGSNDTYTTDDGKELTDYDVIARSRLRVDTRKWWLGKLLPKRYGEKVEVQQTGEVKHTISFKRNG